MPPSPIGPDYHYHVKVAADPSVRPGTGEISYSVGSFETGTGRPVSQLRICLANGDSDRVLIDDAARGAWSAPGDSIAFLRRDDDDREQLWIASADGAAQRQLTHRLQGLDSFAWSPDGRSIAFRALADLSGLLDGVDQPDRLTPQVARRIKYRRDGERFRGEAYAHLFVTNVASGDTRQLTFGKADDGPPAWSPDGARIAFISDRNPFRETTPRNEVYVVSASGGDLDRWSGGLYMVGSITWSPDGSRMAVVGVERQEETGGYGLICQGYVYVIEPGTYPDRITDDSLRPLSTGTGHSVAADMPPIYWMPDDRVLFAADSRGESYICSTWANGEGTERLTAGAEQIVTWSSGGGIAVTASNTPDSVGEIYCTDLTTGDRTRVSHLNDDYLAAHPPASSQRLVVATRDGAEIDCRVWLPPDFDDSKKYPLLLDVHGGPHGVFYNAFYPIHQLAATNGYVVLAPNPRGSSTYGAEFACAVHGDWGGIDYLDVMASLREAVKLPYVDRNRVVIHGSSYGGYMASWAVGHTNRFKAAVIAAPVTDLPSFYGTSDIGVTFSETQFGGPRRQAMAWYLRHSPLTYAAKVETPVLLLHGEDDSRVPISQSEQYFTALVTAGAEVEFVRLPGTSHGIFRAKHAEIRYEYFSRMLAWFEKHLSEPILKIPMPRSNPRLN